MKHYLPQITDRINEVLTESNLPPYKVIEKLKVNKNTYYNTINGVANPSIYFLYNFCEVFKINSQWLMFGKGSKREDGYTSAYIFHFGAMQQWKCKHCDHRIYDINARYCEGCGRKIYNWEG